MPPFDGKAMAADVLAAVRDYVARTVAPLQAKLDALLPPPGMADFHPVIAAEVARVHEVAHEVALITFAEDIRKAVDALPKAKDGTSVTVEDVRTLVVEEISNTIALLPKPKNGEPGRDAAHLEIMPAIDEAKSYPRGTYALHANGTWRAFEQTHGMRGWECMQAGVAEVEVTCAHEREFTISHVLSNGQRFCQTFAIPVAIYRGVFVEGHKYEQGDQVSWGAHQWHCNEATTDKPIEGGKAWTLSVKRGRDGKQGDAGPAGKDRIVREKA